MFSFKNVKNSLFLLLGVFIVLGLSLGSYQSAWEKGARKVVNTEPRESNVNLEIVWDASESMWGRVDGVEKIIKSREVLKNIVDGVPAETKLSLRIFGGKNNENESQKIIVVSNSSTRQDLLQHVSAIKPRGKSPIGSTVLAAEENLRQENKKNNHIVLVTDGNENGEVPLSKAADELKKNNAILHIIHVGKLDSSIAKKLQDYTKTTGGKYYNYLNYQDFTGDLKNY